MTIRSRVDLDNEHWKEYMHTQTIYTNKPASTLLLMCKKTVERIAEVGYMGAVLNQYFFVVQQENSRIMPHDGDKRVVSHSYLPSRDGGEQNEYRFVREHVVGGFCVS